MLATVCALSLLTWTFTTLTTAISTNHGQLIDQYRDHLCAIASFGQIVGVCHLSGRLWIVVEENQESSYLVFEFRSNAVYSTVVDSRLVHSVSKLEDVWKVDGNIRADGERIKAMFALHPHQYDRSKLKSLQSKAASSNDISGGIVFVFSSSVQVYDLQAEVMLSLEYLLPSPSSVLMINAQNSAAILYPDDQWRFESVSIAGSALWPTSPSFLVVDGPTLNDFSWDKDKERVLVFVLGAISEAVTTIDSESAYQAVKWQWAQGYLDDENLMHLFTEHWVYVLERPSSLPGNVTTGQDGPMVALRMLRLNYNDYFVCQKRTKTAIWNRLFLAMLQMKMPQGHPRTPSRFLIICTLFGLLFLSAVVIVMAIICLQLGQQSKRQLEHTNRRKSRRQHSSSKSGSTSSSHSAASGKTHSTTESSKHSKLSNLSKIFVRKEDPEGELYRSKPSKPPARKQRRSARSPNTKRR